MKTVANVFREICYANRDDLTAGIICAGWDKSQGGQVLSIVMTCLEDIKSANNCFQTACHMYVRLRTRFDLTCSQE